jgi:hypothetical protein
MTVLSSKYISHNNSSLLELYFKTLCLSYQMFNCDALKLGVLI